MFNEKLSLPVFLAPTTCNFINHSADAFQWREREGGEEVGGQYGTTE